MYMHDFIWFYRYAYDGLILAIQEKYLFSDRLRQQLIWSRFVNTLGQEGHNISLDLHLEHLNRYIYCT